MFKRNMVVSSALAALALAAASPQLRAGWGVGVRIGGPVYYRAYDPYYYPYYPYRPVYVAPAPVVVESPPVVVQSPPAVQAVNPASPTPLPPPAVLQTSQIQPVSQADIGRYLQQLRDADERVRSDSVLQLGRMKAVAAIDPVSATLAGDRSPLVREAAARALGLLGSPKALPALQHAALADPDRDVRHSAQFAVDVIQSSH
ncbi:MAG TPA: HEAT repeat domain-containing protein [Gemmataceae bacterium]|nr:HEAT repeat domain-containing protein [Gemmataceae bacterium]